MNEALRDWVANVDDTFYFIGTVAGPHPYPAMVRDFQSVIGNETREQMHGRAKAACPTRWSPAIGGGSNAMGLFHPFLDDPDVEIYRRRGGGPRPRDRRACRLARPAARPACCTATAPICCRTTTARSSRRHSISAGLDYPGIGPEHAWLHDIGRVQYRVGHRRGGARRPSSCCCRLEGIIPALEPAHALAQVVEDRADSWPRTTSS